MKTDESSIILFGFNGLFTTEVAEVYALFSKTTVGDRGFLPGICKDPGAGKEKKNKKVLSLAFGLLLCNHLPTSTLTKVNCYISKSNYNLTVNRSSKEWL